MLNNTLKIKICNIFVNLLLLFRLPQEGINQIHIEIFDECSFKMDELIAWTTIPIPIQIYKGVTIEQWYNLTGKQGPNNEGTINIIISYGVST